MISKEDAREVEGLGAWSDGYLAARDRDARAEAYVRGYLARQTEEAGGALVLPDVIDRLSEADLIRAARTLLGCKCGRNAADPNADERRKPHE